MKFEQQEGEEEEREREERERRRGRENMASEPKRRKIEQPRSCRILTSPAGKEDRAEKSVQVAQIDNTYFRIQPAKNFAIAQAQQDGCTGNYRIFDSPFGNYFIPVVPSRKDLAS